MDLEQWKGWIFQDHLNDYQLSEKISALYSLHVAVHMFTVVNNNV